MHSLPGWAVFATLILAVSTPPTVGHGATPPTVVERHGQVVDLVCFVAHGALGRDNAICAEHHTAPHQPLGLLASDGRLYVLHPDHHSSFAFDRCRALAGTSVSVSGVVTQRAEMLLLEVLRVAPVAEDRKGASDG